MTYSTGSLITAADLNTFLTTVRNVYGTGTGDRAMAQTTYSQANVSSGGTITAGQWTALQNMINTCVTHQGTGNQWSESYDWNSSGLRFDIGRVRDVGRR